nr:PREDICTED: uncharacterized protein LOC101313631 isoform X1 [Fragaria vesca subsp. vesca]
MGRCQLKICDRCLKKRYDGSVDGTVITEEEASADDWKCMKCRGKCNCSVCKLRAGQKPHGRVVPANPSVEEPAEGSEPKGKRKAKAPKEPRKVKAKEEVVGPELPLPLGVPLTTVAGIELHPQDVGHTLQFIQFCVAFEEVFGFSKAQAESLLRDLVLQQYTSVFQFHARLLSVQEVELKEEIRPLNKDSWFEHLRCYFSESQLLLKELPSDFFSRGVEGYHSLDFSQKLRVLNFLCDEALDTEKLSKFIESQEGIFTQSKKEANQKVSAAKAKELSLKGELKTEVAKIKAIASEENAASSSDHETTISRLKSEVAQAHAELLQAKALKSKLIAHDSIRTEPYLFDENGHAFWRLTGYDAGKDMLLQDVGTWDPFTSSDEKWFLYGEEKKEAVEKYCSSVRTRKLMNENLSQTLPSSSGSTDEEKLENGSTGGEEGIAKSSAEE